LASAVVVTEELSPPAHRSWGRSKRWRVSEGRDPWRRESGACDPGGRVSKGRGFGVLSGFSWPATLYLKIRIKHQIYFNYTVPNNN